MKFYFATSALATLLVTVCANPAAVPTNNELQSRAVVSCTANGGPAASCCTGTLTRYGCAHTNTNSCNRAGTTACGSIVQIYCYQWGETVNGNSYGSSKCSDLMFVSTNFVCRMWYRLHPNGNGYMPASFFSCKRPIFPVDKWGG
jgi:hypothetical protein